jgi:hypothetical protein
LHSYRHARRPENFNRTMTAAEKKLLEAMLERGLGVQRRKPTAKDKVESARANSAPTHLIKKVIPLLRMQRERIERQILTFERLLKVERESAARETAASATRCNSQSTNAAS